MRMNDSEYPDDFAPGIDLVDDPVAFVHDQFPGPGRQPFAPQFRVVCQSSCRLTNTFVHPGCGVRIIRRNPGPDFETILAGLRRPGNSQRSATFMASLRNWANSDST